MSTFDKVIRERVLDTLAGRVVTVDMDALRREIIELQEQEIDALKVCLRRMCNLYGPSDEAERLLG